jgi:hypothetical protein
MPLDIKKEPYVTTEITYQDKPWLAHSEKGVPENIDSEEI